MCIRSSRYMNYLSFSLTAFEIKTIAISSTARLLCLAPGGQAVSPSHGFGGTSATAQRNLGYYGIGIKNISCRLKMLLYAITMATHSPDGEGTAYTI